MSQPKLIASGLQFPEGPIAMPDGSVILVEIKRGTLTRVHPDGKAEVIATTGGGPNGAAIGPDGACYICNDGGFEWHEVGGLTIPGDKPANYSGGRIERVDLKTGKVDVLYTQCNGNPLIGPNDIVFDKHGGFWFTDHGKGDGRIQYRGGLYYAKIDGSLIKEVAFPILSANGVGLSPDEKTVYVADTYSARLFAFDVVAPGEVAPAAGPGGPGRYVGTAPGHCFFDSLAVDAEGNICVATLLHGGITTFSPDGSKITHTAFDDILPTNICFGGKDLKTAFITLSASGRLVSVEWPTAGLPLNFLNK
ncbi:SMP-30/gluconolactonase/LRE family protein [Parvibaculum sedimenti]|uniref:SMP-30/gluconolactonase/LRE family protein n=2 Tax=Parvibaculum sedimenti TaxID=2608632 RepID=A0A6N6VE00_9HYPH|nr:SMP-30/gluconolactonase/LRE family protein [Parvibaculum sedimenti]KAB7738953.1 SMP-30/gluconolactonase/LRE family protein [Parvibaculum sedimenti]